MPALTLSTAASTYANSADDAAADDVPDSPTSPPYSPITPVMSNTSTSQGTQNQQFSPPAQSPYRPPLEPFCESDNPDAIALRSALSVLQIQRQQALRDLQTLERQKKMAVADPESFSRAIAEGKIKTQSRGVLDSAPDFANPSLPDPDEDVPREVEGEDEDGEPAVEKKKHNNIPGPQNIVRCPPINWGKYHVLGEPLDRLHEEQRRRPVNDQSGDETSYTGRDHVIAAPYSPWKDRLEPPTKANHLQGDTFNTG
ncbi:MAG: hypothetical protein Q9219_004868 [cf. Caloplaca sp. 3 TL-2023]